MKTVKIGLAGVEFFLVFNGAAMFTFEEAFEGSSAYLEKAGAGGRESLNAVCEAAAILAEQGELARRAMGYDKGPILNKEWFLTCTTPADIIRLRKAVLTAIMAGYDREVKPDEDTDLGLIELEQKKTKS